ncbi:MAG: anaerobic ribonucleoside-triphosphate reductase activating protein [bacterium]|nr:anaerobic ribonucleoside-triphosphate reductase activating protein [bacterium]
MIIGGYQPMSLIDYPGKVCSIVFTQGCAFRCVYCHNPDLIPIKLEDQKSKMLSEEVFAHLEKHRNMIEAVCITGGEPTIQKGLRAFIEKIKGMGFDVKLDTNGIHPNLVRKLIDAGLIDYFAMDLKNVWERYLDVIQSGGSAIVEQCRETFEIIQSSGVAHEFRTTICPGVHTKSDFVEMAGYLKDGETYFIQETQFQKTLKEGLSTEFGFSVPDLVHYLRSIYPSLIIDQR